MEAMDIMDSQKIGCLPVVKNNKLVGIITELNYMKIAGRLLKVLHLNEESNEESGKN
jgi:predicted transcriptional regulator